MTGSFRRLALLALALISWALADQIGGNGFIGGLAVRPTVKSVGEQLIHFTEAEGQLLNLSVFFIFGVLVIGLFQPLSWEVAVYALLSLTVIPPCSGRTCAASRCCLWAGSARGDSPRSCLVLS